ncbi:unnamed protein product, partial [Heligmosomoides polygyrus]|uniref:ATP-dependent DNA helicase n=1 Tax=Heligmosomoides polygyrus TaxID=6339 RepID=A0A183GGG3_HELPZ
IENVRASSGGIGWSNFLIQLGNGELQSDSNEVKVPDDMLSSVYIADEIGDIVSLEDMSAAVGRAIMTPRNFDSLEINNKVLSKLPGQEKIYRSIDEVMNDETEANNDTEYSLEFLNSFTPQGYPPHELHLKKGAVITLLRNLRVNQGLCNGTRLTVEHMDRYILGCKIATGANKGQYVLIPRIIFCPPAYDTSPCRFKRRQFPCSVCMPVSLYLFNVDDFSELGTSGAEFVHRTRKLLTERGPSTLQFVADSIMKPSQLYLFLYNAVQFLGQVPYFCSWLS